MYSIRKGIIFKALTQTRWFSLATTKDLHHCGEAAGRTLPVPCQVQREERQRLRKIRFVDLLEGKTARILAILVFVIIVVVLAFIMSQTA